MLCIPSVKTYVDVPFLVCILALSQLTCFEKGLAHLNVTCKGLVTNYGEVGGGGYKTAGGASAV